MNEREDISRNKLASGLVRGAVVSGLAVGLTAASLGGPPNAEATCLGIFGISINLGDGGHCSSSLFGFALGLGPNTVATGDGFFNAAIAVGSNVTALAGTGGPLDFLNLALNAGEATDGATSTVSAGGGGFNLAANLGGSSNTGGGTGFLNTDISAGNGFGNVALNVVGNRNTVSAGGGVLDFATNVGGLGGRGSDSRVTATGSLSAAFQSQTRLGDQCTDASNPGCGNVVTANGPLSLVVAAGVVGKLVEGGITFANSFNSADFPPQPPPATVLAAGGTQATLLGIDSAGTSRNGAVAGGSQGNRLRIGSTDTNANGVAARVAQGHRVRPSLNAAFNRPGTTSPGGSVRTSASDRITKWAKKFSDPASNGTSRGTRDAKAGAESTNSGDK